MQHLATIGTEIIEFFLPERVEEGIRAPNVNDFLQTRLDIKAIDIQRVFNKLESDSYIIRTSSGPSPATHTYQTMKYLQADADYGVYDFAVLGFPEIYDRFKSSVKPIINCDPQGKDSIGTGFWAEYNGKRFLITAKHCIDTKSEIHIFDTKELPILPKSIFIPEKSLYYDEAGYEFRNLDICILTFDDGHFIDDKPFHFGNPEILGEVLVLGYPTTGLFDSGTNIGNAILIAEKASIAFDYLKATKGQTVSQGMLPSTALNYLLISARVKGGNSGGPVIDQNGKVVGIVTQIPMDGSSSQSEKIDDLGFGFVCPSSYIKLLLESIFHQSGKIAFKETIPKVKGSGFTI
jgi:serine protease Do